MSALTAFLVSLAAFLAVVLDLLSEKGPLSRAYRAARRTLGRPTREDVKAGLDEKFDDAQEYIELLRSMVATAKEAAGDATAAAEQAKATAETAAATASAAREELTRMGGLLDQWHEWAVRYWPLLRDDAARLGIPDPPAMADHVKEAP